MLTVVKIILALLIICLVIIVLLLFYPISYRFSLKKMPDEFWVKCKAFWLLGLISCEYFYPTPGSLIVRLLGIPVFDYEKYQQRQKEKEQKQQEKAAKKASKQKPGPGSTTETKLTQIEKLSVESNEADNSDTASYEEPENHMNQEKPPFYDRIITKCKNIWYTIKINYVKIKSVISDAEFFKEILEEDDTKGLLKHALLRLKKTWKVVKPKRIDAEFTIGLSSPDATGYLVAFYGMILPYLSKRHRVYLNSDFEQEIFEAMVKIKGNITSFSMISNAVLFIKDKRLWQLYNRITTYYRKKKKKSKNNV